QGKKEGGKARVALPGGTSRQLAVDPAGFRAFGAYHVQAPGIRHAAAQLDVGASSRHVSRDGNRAALAGPSNDFSFLLMILGIEDGVDDARFLEHPGKMFARLDRDGADED